LLKTEGIVYGALFYICLVVARALFAAAAQRRPLRLQRRLLCAI
jgi:hypothetical protein